MRPPFLRADYDVAGRTVFITGAARGIGAAVATRLHAAGANVALVGLEPELLEQLAASLGDDRAAAFEADVTDFDALQRAVRGTVSRFGGIDVGIANAGISYIGRLATAPVQQVERALEVNLMGVWRTDRALIEQITARRGYLLNVASLAAASHTPLMGPYSASKAGVEALTDCLRAETAPSGARVGCAYFGFIDTDLVRTSFAHPSSQVLTETLPKFVSTPAPLSDAIDAIERGIRRRSARLWAPRYVGGALALRGVLQPLTELQMRFNRDLPRALELADPAHGGLEDQHSELGVSGDAVRSNSPLPPAKHPAQRS
jgi:NAD(P)-dependent dehydrogenase (short-subunit alcohol dehydrogenase family)